jgi:predicted secreted protein
MAKLHGNQAFIYNGAQKILSLQDLKLTKQNKTVDSTDHDDLGWESCIGGNKAWTATCKLVKVLADASQDALFDALDGGTVLPINIYPKGVGSTFPQYQGNCLIEQWDYNAPNTAVQDISVNIKGTGPLTRSVQP